MTCRIDRRSTEQGVVLQVSGRIAADDLEVVRTSLDGRRVVAIDLSEVDLVDREAVNLLAQTEAEGVELMNCPAYVREWITKERESS
jgi:anti-anti-sigma regulatory factor